MPNKRVEIVFIVTATHRTVYPQVLMVPAIIAKDPVMTEKFIQAAIERKMNVGGYGDKTTLQSIETEISLEQFEKKLGEE